MEKIKKSVFFASSTKSFPQQSAVYFFETPQSRAKPAQTAILRKPVWYNVCSRRVLTLLHIVNRVSSPREGVLMDSTNEIRREFYDRLVNSKWPSQIPVPTNQEAITGAKRLYRKAMGRPWTGEVKITSGNRDTYVRRGTLYVNPDQSSYECTRSWRGIVHGLSHWCHWRLHGGNAKPHSDKQAYLERDLTDYVLGHGFLTGALKSKAKAKAKDIVVVRYERLAEREEAWKSKMNRARNALSKVKKERRTYERRHRDRLTQNERAAD